MIQALRCYNAQTNFKSFKKIYQKMLADLFFLFLNVHFEFLAEIFGGSINISCQHTYFLVDFFKTFKIGLSIVSPKGWYH